MKIFILGAGGMLGHKIYQRLSPAFTTWAITRSPFAQYEKFGLFKRDNFIDGIDFGNTEQLDGILNLHQPNVIINCAGVTTRKMLRPSEVIHINSLLPHRLLDWAKVHQRQVIHFSTDCVFNGNSGPYSENSVPDATDFYGRSKILGELTESPGLTIRSSIIGRELFHFTELVEWAISQRSKNVQGFNDVFYSGVTTNYMAYFVEQVLRHEVHLSGLFHLASPRISKCDLLIQLNLALGLGLTITPASGGKRSDKSLLGNKVFESLKNVDKPLWPQMLEELAAEDAIYKEWMR